MINEGGLGKLGGRAYGIDDGREEKGECVEGTVGAHVDECVEPGFVVFDGGPEVLHLEGLVLGGGLLVGFQTADDALAVDVGEEVGFVGEVKDHPEGGEADEDSGETFELYVS